MNIYIVSLFPEIFTSFFNTSLLKKAQEKKIIKIHLINPRIYCTDKHQQIDDQVYGGWAGMLIKAQPIIDAVEDIIKTNQLKKSDFRILFPAPSTEVFTQKQAYSYSKCKNIVFVCGRYEGIDYRFEQYMYDKYAKQFQKISLGQFILLGGEVASMTIIEAISRLIPWVIKETESWQQESYSLKQGMKNLEEPQYTRPEEIYGYQVPKILLTGDKKAIKERQEKESKSL